MADKAGHGRPCPLFWAVLVILCLSVRLIVLNADPPPWLSWSTGVDTDEGFYTLDARHEVLFGTWAPGNFHDRLLSPLLSLLQQAVFTFLGPRLLTARLLAVTFSLLTLAVFWLGLWRVWGERVACYGTLFLGLAPPFVFYNRLALQETPAVFWLVVSFCLWAFGRAREQSGRHMVLLALSGVAFAVAVVFKSLALVALPAFVWAWCQSPPAPNAGGAGWKQRVGGLAPPVLGAGGTLLLYALLWFLPHHAELSRMATYYRVHQMQPHSWQSLRLNIRRGLLGGERGVIPYFLALLPTLCLLVGWGTRRPASPALRGGGAGLFLLWLLGGLLFCLLSSYAPSRYYVLFLPPLAALAALSLCSLRHVWRVTAAVAFLLTSAPWYVNAWTHHEYVRRNAAQSLTRSLPAGSVVVGEFAPSLCLDTQFQAAPVQPGLSNDDRPIERLHAQAVAVTRAPVWQRWWQSRYPDIIQPSHRLFTVTLGGPRKYVVDVYRVKMP